MRPLALCVFHSLFSTVLFFGHKTRWDQSMNCTGAKTGIDICKPRLLAISVNQTGTIKHRLLMATWQRHALSVAPELMIKHLWKLRYNAPQLPSCLDAQRKKLLQGLQEKSPWQTMAFLFPVRCGQPNSHLDPSGRSGETRMMHDTLESRVKCSQVPVSVNAPHIRPINAPLTHSSPILLTLLHRKNTLKNSRHKACLQTRISYTPGRSKP